MNPLEAVGPRSPMTGSPLLTKLLQQYPDGFNKTGMEFDRAVKIINNVISSTTPCSSSHSNGASA